MGPPCFIIFILMTSQKENTFKFKFWDKSQFLMMWYIIYYCTIKSYVIVSQLILFYLILSDISLSFMFYIRPFILYRYSHFWNRFYFWNSLLCPVNYFVFFSTYIFKISSKMNNGWISWYFHFISWHFLHWKSSITILISILFIIFMSAKVQIICFLRIGLPMRPLYLSKKGGTIY